MNRLFIIIISLSLGLILGWGLVFPKYQELSSLRQKIEEKKAEINNQDEYFSNLKKISEELKNYQIQLAKIKTALPSNPFLSLPILLDFFQKASFQSGLVLKEIKTPSIQASPDFKEIQEIALTLVVSGSYPSFKNFLSILEKSARLIQVENISFSGEKKEASLDFNLKIKTYSY